MVTFVTAAAGLGLAGLVVALNGRRKPFGYEGTGLAAAFSLGGAAAALLALALLALAP